MTIIKKFTAIQIRAIDVDNEVLVQLAHGDLLASYHGKYKPTTEFDTEDAAITWAMEENQYAKWVILPTLEFKE